MQVEHYFMADLDQLGAQSVPYHSSAKNSDFHLFCFPDELEHRNPRDQKGRRTHKHHQWLTEDVGHPALAQHLHAVTGLMRASANWQQFHALLDKAFPKRGSIVQLELIES